MQHGMPPSLYVHTSAVAGTKHNKKKQVNKIAVKVIDFLQILNRKAAYVLSNTCIQNRQTRFELHCVHEWQWLMIGNGENAF